MSLRSCVQLQVYNSQIRLLIKNEVHQQYNTHCRWYLHMIVFLKKENTRYTDKSTFEKKSVTHGLQTLDDILWFKSGFHSWPVGLAIITSILSLPPSLSYKQSDRPEQGGPTSRGFPLVKPVAKDYFKDVNYMSRRVSPFIIRFLRGPLD